MYLLRPLLPRPRMKSLGPIGTDEHEFVAPVPSGAGLQLAKLEPAFAAKVEDLFGPGHLERIPAPTQSTTSRQASMPRAP